MFDTTDRPTLLDNERYSRMDLNTLELWIVNFNHDVQNLHENWEDAIKNRADRHFRSHLTKQAWIQKHIRKHINVYMCVGGVYIFWSKTVIFYVYALGSTHFPKSVGSFCLFYSQAVISFELYQKPVIVVGNVIRFIYIRLDLIHGHWLFPLGFSMLISFNSQQSYSHLFGWPISIMKSPNM